MSYDGTMLPDRSYSEEEWKTETQRMSACVAEADKRLRLARKDRKLASRDLHRLEDHLIRCIQNLHDLKHRRNPNERRQATANERAQWAPNEHHRHFMKEHTAAVHRRKDREGKKP